MTLELLRAMLAQSYVLANGYSASTRSSVVLNSRDRLVVVGDSTRCTFTHTTGISPMVSINSRIKTA